MRLRVLSGSQQPLLVLGLCLAEGVGLGLEQVLLLDDQGLVGQLENIVGAFQLHAVVRQLGEPETLLEPDLLVVGIVGEQRAVNVDILEVELREAALLGECVRDSEVAQGQVEIDAGVVGFGGLGGSVGLRHDVDPLLQAPDAVEVTRGVAGVSRGVRVARSDCEQQPGEEQNDAEKFFHDKDDFKPAS